jgi:single-strand DNA-binding protein
MFQQTIVIGHLGNDPEMKFTANGTPVTHFSVAVNEQYGERPSTTWFRVSAWGKLGEVCNQYLGRGRMVLVVGTISANPYTGRDGQAQASLNLTAKTVRFIGTGKQGQDIEAHADNGEDCRF